MSVILIVDDESMIRDLATRILTRDQYTVIAVDHEADARAVFTERAETISAVLLDYSLPNISGTNLVRQFRAMRPNLPCIISSGLPLSIQELPVDIRLCTTILQKPYRSSQLLEAVQEALGLPGAS